MAPVAVRTLAAWVWSLRHRKQRALPSEATSKQLFAPHLDTRTPPAGPLLPVGLIKHTLCAPNLDTHLDTQGRYFPLAVLDEATQATEPASLVPLMSRVRA